MMKFKTLLVVASLLIFFTGCATRNSGNLYYWNGSYETSMYKYLNDDQDFSQQISAMEKSAQKIYETNKKAPPGFYAHLGLLYMNQGNMAQADKNFNKEVKNFPESQAYIAFLRSSKSKRKIK